MKGNVKLLILIGKSCFINMYQSKVYPQCYKYDDSLNIVGLFSIS